MDSNLLIAAPIIVVVGLVLVIGLLLLMRQAEKHIVVWFDDGMEIVNNQPLSMYPPSWKTERREEPPTGTFRVRLHATYGTIYELPPIITPGPQEPATWFLYHQQGGLYPTPKRIAERNKIL